MVLVVLAGVVPLLITPGLLFHYETTPKIAVIAVVGGIGLLRSRSLARGLSALWNRRSGRWLCVLVLAQMAWLAVCSALSSRPWFSMLGTNWRRMGTLTLLGAVVCLVVVAGELCRRDAGTATILRTTSVAAIFASLYGIAQYFDIDPWQSAVAYHAQAGDSTIVRPPGTMGQADYFGWWLAIALFCAVQLCATETGGWRWIGRAAALLSGVAILFSGTRAAMVAVVTGFAFVFVRTGMNVRRIHVAGSVALVVLLAGFYVSPAGTRLRARVAWSATEPAGGARPLLWRDSLRMAKGRPLTGFGPETFATVFPRYQSTDLARLLPAFYQESPHNAALDALTGEGIPGLALAFGWVGLGLYAGNRADSVSRFIAGALVASVIAAMFSAITVGPLIATGLAIAMLVAATTEDKTRRIEFRPWILFVAAAPFGLGLLGYGAALVISDAALMQFQRDSGPATYQRVVQTELPGAAEDLYCARRLSQICNGDSTCISSAAEAAARAISSADNPANAWYNFAIFQAARNAPAPVEKALGTSIVLAPNWFKPHWALARLLAITGRLVEARAEAARALFLDAGKDPEVVQTVRQLTGREP